MFGGTGQLGIEALSHGAKFVYFVDKDRRSIALTKENLSNTIGSNIDPVMSLRSNITIEPGKKKTIYYICGFAKSINSLVLTGCCPENMFSKSSLEKLILSSIMTFKFSSEVNGIVFVLIL